MVLSMNTTSKKMLQLHMTVDNIMLKHVEIDNVSKVKKGVTAVTVYRPVDGVLPDHCLIRRLDSLQLTLR